MLIGFLGAIFFQDSFRICRKKLRVLIDPQGIIVCPCIVGAAIVRSIIAKYGKAIKLIRIDGKIPIHGEIPIYGLPKLQDAVLQIPAGFYFSGVLQHAVGRDRDKGALAI